jgi:nucleotide-binding universal stress UspA family protein
MFERILLPLDGSDIAEMTIPYAKELADSLGSEIILYHVYGHEHKHQEHMHQNYLDNLADTFKKTHRQGEAKDVEIKITTEVEAGEAPQNICNLVVKNKIDLIIITTVSVSGLKIGKMLGGVTDHLCRTVPIPVLLIRPHDIQRIERKKRLINHILIPQDGSALSKLALPIGEELAAKLQVPITLFEMATMLLPYDFGYGMGTGMGYGGYVDYGKFDEVTKKQVNDEMSALQQELKEKELDVTYSVTLGIDATGEIIKVGKEVGADLTVMATHGRSGLNRWALGSVAERVLRYGKMPLLLINARA